MKEEAQARIRKAFAKRFCVALKQAGYSVNQHKQMSKLFGVSGQAVHKWAYGISMPITARISDIAKVLGVRRAWLQDGEEPMRMEADGVTDDQREGVAQIWMTEEEAALIAQHRMLAFKQKKVLQEVMAAFLALRNP